METLEAIRGRAMYRGRLEDRPVDAAHLEQLIEAATWAPSGHNSQPWEFLALDDPALIIDVATIAAEKTDAWLATSPDLKEWVNHWCAWLRWSEDELSKAGDGIYFRRMHRDVFEELQTLPSDEERRTRLMEIFGSGGRPSPLLTTAPCLIYTLLNRRRQIPDFSSDMLALTSAGAAMQNLRLAAHALGLAAHEQSPLYDLPQTREAVGARLGIPDYCRIVGGMRIGYPTTPVTSSMTHIRRPAERFLHLNGHGPSALKR